MRSGFFVCFTFALTALMATAASGGDLDPPGAPSSTAPLEARTAVTAIPATLDGPGSYYLVGNLTGVADQSGIIMTGEGVTLDLNGFSLIGVAGSLNGIEMVAHNSRVFNGTVRDWGGSGITIGTGALIESVHVDNCSSAGAEGGSGAVVRSSTFSNCGGNGLRVYGDSVVENCTSWGNTFNGFVLESASQGVGLVATSNGSGGIAGGFESSISNSNASDNDGPGIRIIQGTLNGCTASGNYGGGIEGRDATIINCTSHLNRFDVGATPPAGYGIRLIEECHLESSTATDNNGIGIIAEDNNTVLNCTVSGNAKGTNLIGSVGGVVISGAGNRIDGNSVSDNFAFGIVVTGTDNFVIRNAVTNSGNALHFGVNNAYGPEIDVSRIGDITAATGDTHPWANFEF